MIEENHSTPLDTFRLERTDQRLLLTLGDIFASLLAFGASLLFWAKRDKWLGLSIEFIRTRLTGWFKI